ncbi:MAG TPA: polyprenyl synthetase family protein [Gemmatimonadaceae bacterium]|nr:polyprenyl synthetase family protein [Gemmatimonadaceae bacterium]
MIAVDEAQSEFAAERAVVDAALESFAVRYLGPLEGAVASAVRYSMLGEGKRLRAILLLATYRAAGGAGDAGALAAAVEVVHAYSLVHDDLPCMDDDAVRRGQPAVHRAYGVPAATAAGLAMVPLAARAAADAARSLGLDWLATGTIVRTLMRAAGAGGMIGGQLLDLEAEGTVLSLDQLERVHRLKTGALIGAAVRIGALAASARGDVREGFARYGDAVGLAFQIADDVLDVTSTTDQLGKTAGRDAALRKSTYPALLGLSGARARAAALSEDACRALRVAGIASPPLEQLARFVVARQS